MTGVQTCALPIYPPKLAKAYFRNTPISSSTSHQIKYLSTLTNHLFLVKKLFHMLKSPSFIYRPYLGCSLPNSIPLVFLRTLWQTDASDSIHLNQLCFLKLSTHSQDIPKRLLNSSTRPSKVPSNRPSRAADPIPWAIQAVRREMRRVEDICMLAITDPRIINRKARL